MSTLVTYQNDSVMIDKRFLTALKSGEDEQIPDEIAIERFDFVVRFFSEQKAGSEVLQHLGDSDREFVQRFLHSPHIQPVTWYRNVLDYPAFVLFVSVGGPLAFSALALELLHSGTSTSRDFRSPISNPFASLLGYTIEAVGSMMANPQLEPWIVQSIESIKKIMNLYFDLKTRKPRELIGPNQPTGLERLKIRHLDPVIRWKLRSLKMLTLEFKKQLNDQAAPEILFLKMGLLQANVNNFPECKDPELRCILNEESENAEAFFIEQLKAIVSADAEEINAKQFENYDWIGEDNIGDLKEKILPELDAISFMRILNDTRQLIQDERLRGAFERCFRKLNSDLRPQAQERNQ